MDGLSLHFATSLTNKEKMGIHLRVQDLFRRKKFDVYHRRGK